MSEGNELNRKPEVKLHKSLLSVFTELIFND